MDRSFNGTSDRITADAAHIFDGYHYSFFAWVKGSARANEFVFSEGSSASINNCIGFGADTTTGAHLRIFIKNNTGGTTDVSGSITCFDNTWHAIGASLSPSSEQNLLKGYVDGSVGSSQSTWTIASAHDASPNELAIGCLRRSSTGNFFAGSIAHVAIWTRFLTDKEHLSLASGLPPSHLGPTHYWPLWGVDSPEPDIGNG